MSKFEKITASEESMKEFIISVVNGDCGICPACGCCNGDCDYGIESFLCAEAD